MPDYNEIYPKLICEKCQEFSHRVIVYHQRTSYENIEDNYATLCPDCKQENDEYWNDMWIEYYRGCM